MARTEPPTLEQQHCGVEYALRSPMSRFSERSGAGGLLLAVVAPFAFAACSSPDPRAEPISLRVELPKKFTREAVIDTVVTNEGSEPVFVATLDGTRIKLVSEFRRENGFSPWGGNRPFGRDGVVLAKLGPGASFEGRIRVDELPPITGTTDPSALDWEGSLDSVGGEFRLSIELHTRDHAATERPHDCVERRLASASFDVPLTVWTR